MEAYDNWLSDLHKSQKVLGNAMYAINEVRHVLNRMGFQISEELSMAMAQLDEVHALIDKGIGRKIDEDLGVAREGHASVVEFMKVVIESQKDK